MKSLLLSCLPSTNFNWPIKASSFFIAILSLLLLAPLIFLLNLLQLRWCPIVFDVEVLTNLFWALSFDHVCDLTCCQPEQARNVQVVGSGDLKRESLHNALVKNGGS